VQLAIRSGQFKTINVREVREGEYLGEDFISGEMQFKQVADRINKKVIGYLAYFRLINGFEKMSYWTIEEMEKHARQYSQSYNSQYPSTRESSKWTTDFDAMAKKTILKLLLAKYAPLSIEMQTAVKSDQAVIDEDGERYVDNEQPAVIATAEQSKKAVDIMTQGFADAEIVEETIQE
jgi:recombination protein RecT